MIRIIEQTFIRLYIILTFILKVCFNFFFTSLYNHNLIIIINNNGIRSRKILNQEKAEVFSFILLILVNFCIKRLVFQPQFLVHQYIIYFGNKFLHPISDNWQAVFSNRLG